MNGKSFLIKQPIKVSAPCSGKASNKLLFAHMSEDKVGVFLTRTFRRRSWGLVRVFWTCSQIIGVFYAFPISDSRPKFMLDNCLLTLLRSRQEIGQKGRKLEMQEDREEEKRKLGLQKGSWEGGKEVWKVGRKVGWKEGRQVGRKVGRQVGRKVGRQERRQ